MKLTRSRSALYLLAAALLAAGIGWASNAASLLTCQRQVAFPLIEGPLADSSFFLDCHDRAEELAVELRSAGAIVRSSSAAADAYEPFPRMTLDSHASIPFFVSIDYRWELEGEVGAGATRWFLCFFGRAFAIGETGRYVT
jgi:hypothetical protein